MKKKIVLATGIVAALALTGCSGGGAGSGDNTQLNIYGWADEIPQPVFDKFTEETGIKINFDAFDSNETMISKLSAGNAGYASSLQASTRCSSSLARSLSNPSTTTRLKVSTRYPRPS